MRHEGDSIIDVVGGDSLHQIFSNLKIESQILVLAHFCISLKSPGREKKKPSESAILFRLFISPNDLNLYDTPS